MSMLDGKGMEENSRWEGWNSEKKKKRRGNKRE